MEQWEENENRRGRVIIAAPGSGAGKTWVTCALIRLLARRGVSVAAFKCGPDFIDPMFHREVLGVPSENLDLFLAGREGVRRSLARSDRTGIISVIEGVMGYYDGMGADSLDGSTWAVAETTDTPVILVLNVKGMSRSIVPLAAGFLRYQNTSHIRGVILNRVSPSVYPAVKARIEKELGISVLGYMPEMNGAGWNSRRLGLVEPGEITDLLAGVDAAADALGKSFDAEAFFRIAAEAACLGSAFEIPHGTTVNPVSVKRDSKIRIAVARDAAFSFYYEENLRLLEELGGRICFFSPIADRELPPDTSGLILGGGYPELHAAELSNNKGMLRAIREAAAAGMPILAECGGFLYLLEQITDEAGNTFPLTSVLSGRGFMTQKLVRFGYVEVETKENTPFLPRGARIRAHEFHYADSTDNGHSCRETKPISGRTWPCMVSTGNIFAGFPHLYYPSCPQLVCCFLKKSRDYCLK